MLLCVDMGAAVQLMGIIRTLLDPENMLASVNKSEKTDFLNHFYKHCMHGRRIHQRERRHDNVTFAVFIAPLLSNTVDSNEKQDNSNVQVQVSQSFIIVLKCLILILSSGSGTDFGVTQFLCGTPYVPHKELYPSQR